MSTTGTLTIEERAAQAPPAGSFSWEGEPQLLWVATGAVDIFLAPRAADGTSGARHPLCRVRSGAVFVAGPLPAALSGWRAMAVPLQGTRIVPVGDLLAGAAPLPAVQYAIEEWAGAMLHAVRRGITPGRYQPLEVDSEVLLVPGEACATTVATAWVEVVQGEVLLLGNDALRYAPGAIIPLHPDGWVIAATTAELRTVTFEKLRGSSRVLPALGAYQDGLLAVFQAAIVSEDHASAERMAAQRAAAEHALRGAVQRLAGVVEEQYSVRSDIDAGGDAILSACRLVGRAQNIEFPDLPRAVQGLTGTARVRAVAEAAQVRQRRVALRGSWWREDNGPLLAFRDEDGVPVALLREAHGYVAVAPGGVSVPVDADVAGSFAPFAFSFFRALAARQLGIGDLITFAFAGRWRELRFIAAMATLLGVLGTLSPMAIGYLFDNVIPAADRVQLAQMTAVLLGVAVVTLFFSLARALTLLRLEAVTDTDLQAAVWDRVLKLPVTFFRDYAAGDLATRINAINTARQQLSGATLNGVLSGIFSVFNLALLFYYDVQLAWLALGMVAIVVFANVVAGWFVLRSERLLAGLDGRLSGQVLQFLIGVSKLRVAAAEARVFGRWARQFAEARMHAVRAETWRNVAEVVLPAFFVVATAVLFYAMGRGVQASADMAQGVGTTTSTGQFVALTGAFTAFFLSFIQMSDTLLELLRIVPQLERARPILDSTPEVTLARTHPGELRGEVAVSNLMFRYRADGPPVLDGVSFSAQAGEFVAIVGPSGSGKSTLMRLLLGFERPEAGSIYFDGQDLADLDLRAVRNQLGVVLQSSQLMPGDIYTNIVGTSPLSVEDAWEAARLCGLDEDIEAMPMGMHTVISEGASTFSGGQRQRMLIARAIVRRPRILLFDEATSALDNRTQAIVANALQRLKATRIVIAHRLSTVIHADRIIVLDRGCVVQSGTYDELMAQPGLFAELALRQVT